MPKYIVIMLREFFEICIFQKRPQDIPAARELFWVVILLYTVISSVLSYPAKTINIALLTGFVESVMLLLITYLFLYLRSVPDRWLQTTTALAGTGIIFSLFAFPLFYIRIYVESDPPLQDFIMALIIMMVIWNIAVMSHILKNALSSSYLLAVPGALTYIAIITLTLQQLIPVSETI